MGVRDAICCRWSETTRRSRPSPLRLPMKRFYASGPDVNRLMITLGKEAEVFRSSMSIPGRRRPLRHLVAISEELSKTRAGGNPTARRTILCDDDRAFLLYRIGVRFGLPVLPE